ncbi:MAG: rod shape-determining protein [Hyphomicrobiaceae bacterium TMED74]|nr:rod shape-determining protein [Filomicrobium sp.]RPG44734.1 MAG: rod shape-determining protein [Hyphomicrobiaceae bacterium TMED74]
MLSGVGRAFSDDVAIDLGTANTLIHVVDKGILIDEPSIVAIRNRNGLREVLAVGQQAKLMLGRTPETIETIRPLRDGVIADFIATEEMLRQFIKKTKSMLGFRRPRILICVPAGATPVERRAVYETALTAGARRVYMVEEPVAASIGAGLAINDPFGLMVVDIGGGTTDIAVLSLGGVVQARSLRCAGNSMDEAIIRFVRRNHQLLIGEANAERIKIEAGTAVQDEADHSTEIHIRGRDLRQGRPKSIVLNPGDIAGALEGPIEEITEFVQRSLEDLPPEIASDICDRGIHLTGGGALLNQLDFELERRIGVKFLVPENPTHCVVKGTAVILKELATHDHLLIKP